MSVLTKELAENIVERTMQVVNYNINIMNEQGVIIASGDKERIGTIHEGAIIAIQRKAEFSIDEKQSKNLNGVHQGTNLIIEFQQEIVGVIGITGRPKDVLGYGKLIKMTAEMMIEQAFVLKEIEWNNRIKEEMMIALINNKQGSFRLLDEYTKKFSIPYNHPMVVFIFEIASEENHERADLNVLNKIVTHLEGVFKDVLVAVVDSKTIVLLYKCSKNTSNNKLLSYEDKMETLHNDINEKLGIEIRISIGKIYDKLFDVHKSYEIARETLKFGKKIYPNRSIYIFDLIKYEMLFTHSDENWKVIELKDTYELLVSNDKNGELRETLKVLIEESGELNNIASRLFIHRNTLNYRLNKIYKLTNKNPKKYTDLFWLYSAMINFQNK